MGKFDVEIGIDDGGDFYTALRICRKLAKEYYIKRKGFLEIKESSDEPSSGVIVDRFDKNGDEIGSDTFWYDDWCNEEEEEVEA